jgi:uncharacterized protein
MKTKNLILKIYVSSTDKHNGVLFFEHLVTEAKHFGISGVTVYKGIMGYGLSANIHTSRFWELTEKLPVVIEIIDLEEKIQTFIEYIKPVINELPKGCLIITQPAEIVIYKPGKKKEN